MSNPNYEPTLDDLMDLEQFLDSRPDIREMLED